MKNKREIIILIAIIIVLGVVYSIQQSAKRPGADNLPQPAKFTTADIAKIEITTPEEILSLVLVDGQWRLMPVNNSEGYTVDERLSAIMPEALVNFKLTAIISESDNDYARYQLDDANKITIKAYAANGEKLLDFDLGSAVANNFKHSYVKMAGDPNVYHGRGNLRTFFDTNEFELREKQIFKFNNDEIAAIAIDTFADKGRTLIESQQLQDDNGNDIKIWTGPQSIYVDSGEIESFINFVKSTFVYEFLPADAAITDEPEWGLTFFYADGRDNEVLKVYSGIPSPDGEEYGQTHMATSTDVGSPFLLTMAQQSDIFKLFSELLIKREADGTPSGQLHVENLPADGAEPAEQPNAAVETTPIGFETENSGGSTYSGGNMPTTYQNVEAQEAALPSKTSDTGE